MSAMLSAVELIGVVVLIVLAHELTHLWVARLHGQRLICVSINPIGVAVVFEGEASHCHAVWQVVAPLLVTLAATVAWLWLAPSGTLGSDGTGHQLSEQAVRLAALLAVLTSGGDIVGSCLEAARPLCGADRVERDLRFLRRLPGLTRFTGYGRARWESFWHGLGRPVAPAADQLAG